QFEFSRDSALRLGKFSIDITEYTYKKLKQSRLLSSRGIGEKVSSSELRIITDEFISIEKWFNKLSTLIK
ncbi:TPA: hypothetical protein ACG0AT_003745, partial [Elizabethkingia anophelis]